MKEEILGRVEVEDKWGNLLNVVFTSNRIIVARLATILPHLILPALFGGPGDWRKERRERREEYGRLSAESILKADEKNFEISYTEIVKVEMKKPGTFRGAKIKIFTSNKTYEFTSKEKKDLFDERINLVRSVLPDKLSITQEVRP